jgi:hypothetical protein
MCHRGWAIAAIFLISTNGARAEHASIDLRITHYEPGTGRVINQASSYSDEEPPLGGNNPRPSLKVKAGQPLVVQFFYTNTYPHAETPDVTIRYYVARVDKIGQKTAPDLGKGTITRGSFTLNFKPKARVGARLAFKIPEPGIYLLRVESANSKSDHEHFSAIDVVVE